MWLAHRYSRNTLNSPTPAKCYGVQQIYKHYHTDTTLTTHSVR